MSRTNALLLALATLAGAGGCSFGYPEPARPEPYGWVRLVGKAPPRGRYAVAGTVQGVAPDTDFVAAARAAHLDIRYKAAQLGADLVRVEEVRLPSRRHDGRTSVLLVGTAYRTVDPARARVLHKPARRRSASTTTRVARRPLLARTEQRRE